MLFNQVTRRYFFLSMAGMVALLLSFTIAFASEMGRYVHPPRAVPDIQFMDMNGKTRSVMEFKGKNVIVLNFWATWCGPCVEEMPALNRLQKKLASKGVLVLPVALERKQNKNALAAFYQRHHLDALPFAWDRKEQGANLMRVNALPTTFIINREGNIIATIDGMVDWDNQDYSNFLESLR